LGIWKIKIWDFWRKRVGTRNIFDRTDAWSLMRANTVVSDAWSLKRAASEQQASNKRAITEASVTWSLKRAVPSSTFLCFSFRALGDQSRLSKMFLLTCLISVYTLKPTGTSFESNWT